MQVAGSWRFGGNVSGPLTEEIWVCVSHRKRTSWHGTLFGPDISLGESGSLPPSTSMGSRSSGSRKPTSWNQC